MQNVSAFSLPVARPREYTKGELILLSFSIAIVIFKFHLNTRVYPFVAQLKE